MGAPRDRPDQLGGEVGAVLVELSGLAAVIRFTVIVLPLTAPLTCTAPPTGNCSFLDQVQHDPAVAPVIAQQVEIAGGDKASSLLSRLAQGGMQLPEPLRKGVIEVHAGDGLHLPAVK